MTDDPIGALGVKMLRDEIERLRHRIAEKQDCLDNMEREIEQLCGLVRVLIDNDPDDMAADGVTILDVWRKEARAALSSKLKS